jgi:hypothetical protein
MDTNEADELDPHFFDRADAHINLSNDQMQEQTPGKVSASMMYATARFNAWWAACGFRQAEEFAASRQEQIDYYVEQYRSMLEANLTDYTDNFNSYILNGAEPAPDVIN